MSTSSLDTYTVSSSPGVNSASALPLGPSPPGTTSMWFFTLSVEEVSVIVVW